jgi:transcriptional regulator with XRE-family HTH domain
MIHALRHGLKQAIRKMRGHRTQAEFASSIGISQSALARMESPNNEVFPSTPLLIRIAMASGCDLRVSFLNRADEREISARTDAFSKTNLVKTEAGSAYLKLD